jgi:hypothetical protein
MEVSGQLHAPASAIPTELSRLLTQRVMEAKLTRLSHKIAMQLHLVAESCTICSSRSRLIWSGASLQNFNVWGKVPVLKYQTIKTHSEPWHYTEVRGQLHNPTSFTPGERASGSHGIEGRSGRGGEEKRSPPVPGIEPRSSSPYWLSYPDLKTKCFRLFVITHYRQAFGIFLFIAVIVVSQPASCIHSRVCSALTLRKLKRSFSTMLKRLHGAFWRDQVTSWQETRVDKVWKESRWPEREANYFPLCSRLKVRGALPHMPSGIHSLC